MAINPRTVISREITKIGLGHDDPGHYIYFYALCLDGKACAKIGKTSRILNERIHKYLEEEHRSQDKDYDTFRLVFVIKFEKEQLAKTCERFIQATMKPLNKTVSSRVEQYELLHAWDKMATFIKDKTFPFADKCYSYDEIRKEVMYIIEISKNKQAVKSVQIIVTSQKPERSKSNREDMLEKLNGPKKEEFMTLHNIGPGRASALVAGQPYKCIEGVLDIKGIGKTSYDVIISYLRSQ